MKTIIKYFTLLVFFSLTTKVDAQQFFSTGICAGNSIPINAINSLTLSNPSYSLNPGGLTSASPVFTVTPANPTTYTLYVTGTDNNSQIVTTSNTVSIYFINPTFDVASPQNFVLSCGPNPFAIMNIQNQNTVPPGGSMNFSCIGPANSGVLVLSTTATSFTADIAGAYTFWATDNASGCSTSTIVLVTQNTLGLPGVAVSMPTQTLSCNVPSVNLQGTISPYDPNITYEWNFQNGSNPNTISSATMVAFVNQTVPNNTICGIYSLTATNQNNGCSTSTVVTIFQNIMPPVPYIIGAPPLGGPCSSGVTLVNASYITSTMFPVPLGTSAILWEGPSPQATASNVSNYFAQTTGDYTMTVMDMNNGCTSSTTTAVYLTPLAGFAHTLAAGQATFNSLSVNVSTNTSYYWDFGDGYTSLAQNPTHTYLNGGAHLVTLIVSNASQLCADTLIQSVNVSGVPCVANSNFSMVPTATAQVWDVIPDYPWNISNASWDWGDGSYSNTLYTSHQYASAGMYNICLSVTVSCAASSSTCTNYNIYRMSQQAQVIAVNVVAPALISGITQTAKQEDASWSIVPNPNAGEFKINFNSISDEQTNIAITDLTGRLLQEHMVEPNQSSVSVNSTNLPQGMYLVTITAGKSKVTKRMVISQ